MTFREFLKQANQLAEEHPEALDLEVFQTSCFDDPYRFASDSIYIDEVFAASDGQDVCAHFNSHEAAVERMQYDGILEEEEIQDVVVNDRIDCVVISAY